MGVAVNNVYAYETSAIVVFGEDPLRVDDADEA